MNAGKSLRNKYFFAVLFFALGLQLFAVGGNVFHNKKLSVIKTEFFDVIFSEESIVSAKKVAAVADSYYREISERLGTEPYQRFPVSITREEESFNGFFSPATFNMIVLYESLVDSPTDSYEKTIETVFYHELTHAVTLNYKSAFWRGMSFFGDFMNPAVLSMSYFWLEGSSVLFESSMEENKEESGRLHNPYFTELVSAAKIEAMRGTRKFPDWRDVAGSRDAFPGGNERYAFGACFAKYLIEKYGQEKYGELWKNSGTSTNFSFVAGIFKKTYGIKMDDAWKDFYEWIPAFDFCRNSEDSRKLISSSEAAVKTMDSYFDSQEKSFRAAYYDVKSSGVYLYSAGVVKKLFSATGVMGLSFSHDGKKLAVTRVVALENTKYQCGIYDIEKKTYSVVSETGGKAAYFDSKDELRFINISESIDSNEKIFSPLTLKNGMRACIVKNGTDWKIRVGEHDFSLGKIMIHGLHLENFDGEKVSFCFTWANFGKGLQELSRIGRIEMNLADFSAKIFLQEKDNFAGIIDVVPEDFSGEKRFFLAVAKEYESNPIYEIALSDEDFSVSEISFNSRENEILHEEKSIHSELTSSGFTSDSFRIEPYSPLPYLLKGIKLPLGIVPVMESNFTLKSLGFLGATYATSTPWLNNVILLSGGFDPIYKDGGLALGIYGFDSSINYTLIGTALFNSEGFMQTYGKLSLSKNLFRGLVSYFQVGADSDIFYGKNMKQDYKVRVYMDDDYFMTIKRKGYEKGFYTDSQIYGLFSNLHKVGSGSEQISGFSAKLFLDFEYSDYKISIDGFDFDFSNEMKYLNLGGTVAFRIPGFIKISGIPFEFFPITLQASIFPSSEYFFSPAVRIALFSSEIQKGIPAVSLYATRFTVFTTYVGKFYHYNDEEYFSVGKVFDYFGDFSKEDYSDKLTLGAELILNPNTGVLADPSVQFTLGTNLNYSINTFGDDGKWSFDIVFSIMGNGFRKSFK